MQPTENDHTPRRFAAVFRRRAPIVLICFVVAVGAALFYSLGAQKKYTATASLLFNNSPLSQQIAGLQAVVNTNQQAQQDTNAQLLKLGDLAQKTASRVGHGLTAQEVAASITVSPTGDTTVVDLSSTLPSPSLAAQVANTYADTFVSEQQNGNHDYYASALATVEQQISKLSPAQAKGPQGLALQNRAQSLATLAQIRNDTVSKAQSAAVPTSPSSPKTRQNVLIAALVGLLFGGVIALGVERFDQQIRDPEELESIYELPLLGVVPNSASLRRGRRSSRASAPSSGLADSFQFMRARLRYFNVDRDLRVLAIVSAQSGDGKTTITHWLADAAVTMGSRVLLIEADLRRPTSAEELGVQAGPGLADVLIGVREFDEVIQPVKVKGPRSDASEPRGLDVIVAGALPPNPAEMLESHAMSGVIEKARKSYDFVVIDTPPLGAVSDAMPLMTIVDGVVIVAAIGRNRRDVARRLGETLRSVEAPLLGVIANRVKARKGSLYGYGYGYGYASANQADQSDDGPSENGDASEGTEATPTVARILGGKSRSKSAG